jgi:hypothetical protein
MKKQRMIRNHYGWMTAEADFAIILESRGHWSVRPMTAEGIDWNNFQLTSHVWGGVKQDAIDEIEHLRKKKQTTKTDEAFTAVSSAILKGISS